VSTDAARAALLRGLPAVHEVLEALRPLEAEFPRSLIAREVRAAIEEVRQRILQGNEAAGADVEARAEQRLRALGRPSLRRVINATGVILHTNLGRAPLPELQPQRGYSNLEYDVVAGARGKRDVHVAALIEQLLGAPGIAVNNNAAAVYLALNELAAGGEVIVSRGELIEIGDGFRIPDIMARSGALLREVGTTNRTRIEDYRDAISERTRLILMVHPSNFRIEGFTAKPSRREIVSVAHERGLPVYEDLGSGCLVDLREYGIDEPLAQEALNDGVDLVSFSGDKMLGGPQAGLLAGRADLVARLRRNPMFRALRLDKLIYHALETTLRILLLEQWDRLPVLKMIREPAERIRERAESFVGRLKLAGVRVERGDSVIGGGSTPQQSLPTWLIAISTPQAAAVERKLRESEPPVIARIEEGRVLLDLRTVLEGEEELLARALQDALSR
jgi:L-seryl-tRNA(Ser) seleniumtransferase